LLREASVVPFDTDLLRVDALAKFPAWAETRSVAALVAYAGVE